MPDEKEFQIGDMVWFPVRRMYGDDRPIRTRIIAMNNWNFDPDYSYLEFVSQVCILECDPEERVPLSSVFETKIEAQKVIDDYDQRRQNERDQIAREERLFPSITESEQREDQNNKEETDTIMTIPLHDVFLEL